MLTIEGCRDRQERLRGLLAKNGIDALAVTDPRDVYYLTGFWGGVGVDFPVFALVETNGQTLLINTIAGDYAADEHITYEAALYATMHPDPLRRLGQTIQERLSGAKQAKKLACLEESLPRHIGNIVAETLKPDEWTGFDEQLLDMQSRKDPDEIAVMRGAIACSLAAYDAAKATIRPGVTELEVEEAGHRAATLQAGEGMFHFGDYQSGQIGGFPRNRIIEDGELYVIDAWTVFQGYWSDLCRTFAVGETTPLQREVFAHIREIQLQVPERLKPGMRGTDLFRWMDSRVREHPQLRESGMIHHAGHATGLRGHEMPDLNRDREGIMEPGVVVSVEPGGYSEELRGGVRLENTYLITETGCELLSDYPMAL